MKIDKVTTLSEVFHSNMTKTLLAKINMPEDIAQVRTLFLRTVSSYDEYTAALFEERSSDPEFYPDLVTPSLLLAKLDNKINGRKGD